MAPQVYFKRKQWKFHGYVTSDTDAIDNIFDTHGYTSSWNETVAIAVRAGCDVESATWEQHGPNKTDGYSSGGFYIDHLANAVKAGLIAEAAVDKAVRNGLEIRFRLRLGLFDPIDDQPFWNVSRWPRMLLNPNQRVSVIGPHVNDRTVLLGNYLGEICADDRSHGCVISFFEGFHNITKSHGGSSINSTGCSVLGKSTDGFGIYWWIRPHVGGRRSG
jgi:beta-D-xylosidase 4